MLLLFGLCSPVNFKTLVDHFAELLNFFESLFILLFHLSDNLERSVLFAKDSIAALTVNSLHLEEVVVSASALNVEGDHAPLVIALNASSIVFLATDDALHLKPLDVDPAHAHRRLRGHSWARYPHGAAQMHPLVQSLCRLRL